MEDLAAIKQNIKIKDSKIERKAGKEKQKQNKQGWSWLTFCKQENWWLWKYLSLTRKNDKTCCNQSRMQGTRYIDKKVNDISKAQNY